MHIIPSPLVLLALYYNRSGFPVNYVILGLLDILASVAVSLTCCFTNGKVNLVAVISTTVVVVSLTLYTFWASRRGHKFKFHGPFFFVAIAVLLGFGMAEQWYPDMDKLWVMIYGCVASITFCGYSIYDTSELIKRGYIIYDTNELIKRKSIDRYIWSAMSLYLSIITLLLELLTVFRAADGEGDFLQQIYTSTFFEFRSNLTHTNMQV
ncbi:protein LIFEGUARD 2-like [Cornus florida]|uniref:protein LIFEGUARD 2-like n=1 Tax=Cornus florida TaxID=4283 RepID=UPI0028972796|nr:protein LIFEGUARD 2-like [Cornus florida]